MTTRTLRDDGRSVLNALRTLVDRVVREPVLIGAAMLAQYDVRYPHASKAAHVAALAWVAIFQRMFSTPTKTATEDVATALATPPPAAWDPPALPDTPAT